MTLLLKTLLANLGHKAMVEIHKERETHAAMEVYDYINKMEVRLLSLSYLFFFSPFATSL